MKLYEAANKVAKRVHDTSPEAITRIMGDLNVIKDKIIRKSDNWSWMSGKGQFSTVADQYNYTLATLGGETDIARILGMRIPEERRLLRPSDIYEFQSLSMDTTDTRLPEMFTVWDDEVYLSPTPGEIYTVDFLYYKTNAELGENESPPWPSEFDFVWMLGAEYMSLQYDGKENYMDKRAEFRTELREMLSDDPVYGEEIILSPYTARNHGMLYSGYDENLYPAE